MVQRLVSLLPLCLLVFTAGAQDRLLSPGEFLGYEPGEDFTPHHRVVDYLEHVASASPLVRIEPYGKSVEGRPLMVAYISSPDNLERIEDIRTDNLRRAGLADGAVSGPPRLVVWLSYNVHGNEAAGTEAALATLYELIRPGNAQAASWLEDVVVIMDPCLNPDGRERYVQWYRQTRGQTPDPDPAAREHFEPWPGGRSNHYYFDLNRDWAWQVQPETRARVALYNRWMPQVHVDFHEQGVDAPYYFAPAAEPYHDRITPWQREFQMVIGRNNAKYFDANNWLYFTRQVFDLFYPSYGDTWPTFNGAIGMTYEQGGSGRAGLAIRTSEGDTLTLRDRVAHHVTSGLSTIETAVAHRDELLTQFEAYFDQGDSPQGDYQTFVLRSGHPDGLSALTSYLDRQGIVYGYAVRDLRTSGYRYADSEEGPVTVMPGDLVVSTRQPKSTLVTVLFEPRPILRDSLTYDLTAWALPYVYGLEAYALTGDVETRPEAPAADPRSPAITGQPYAYLAEWRSTADASFLAGLLKQGIRVRFTQQPFVIGDRTFAQGTLILTRAGNEGAGQNFDRIVKDAASRADRTLYPVESGFVTTGPDFGSDDVRFLRTPRIAVLSGPSVSPYALGEVRFFLEQELDYPATLIDVEQLGNVRLHEYDVIVMPGGSYTELRGEGKLTELKNWIRGGGRLIALESALDLLSGDKDFGLVEKAGSDSADAQLTYFGDRGRAGIADDVPGSIFSVRLDSSHPLAFGYSDTYYSLKRSVKAYSYLTEGWNVGTIGENALRSGFAGHKALSRLTEVLVFGEKPMGRGSVVYMVDNPLFRGFWESGKLLMANALFFVGQ